jgi:hypothetical protein
MKRFVLVLVALSAMGMFAACKKDKKKADETGEAVKTTDTAATDTAATDKPADPAAGGDTAAADKPADPAAGGDTAAAGGDARRPALPSVVPIKRLMSCDKYPQRGKDALKQSMDAWKQAAGAKWRRLKAAADACRKRTRPRRRPQADGLLIPA